MYPDLIVMLTYNDKTVKDAAVLFDILKDYPIKYWGFKNVGLPVKEMKQLIRKMKAAGKTTKLEVVSMTEEEGLEAAKLAVDVEIDVLMGTVFFDSINEYLKNTSVKYVPFVGEVYGHPNVLNSSIEEIVDEVKMVEAKGVDGIDLLTYRYTGNPKRLLNEVVKATELRVVSAGSIDSYQRISEVSDSGAWAFTIGTAFFEKKFKPGCTFEDNVLHVWDWLNNSQ